MNIRELKQTDVAGANLQIPIQKDSKPSKFSRPLTFIILNLNGDLPVDRRRVSLFKLPIGFFLLLLLQAIVIIMGIALINAKARSVIVFAIILFLWDIEGNSWLMTWLALSCNSQSYNDLQSALSSTPWYRPSQFVEAWKSSVEGVICESKLQHIAHTVKFTKLANMITLKRSLIAQSQKSEIAYTRPQVRIIGCNFNDNYKIKQNIILNVNRSQKHGPMLH